MPSKRVIPAVVAVAAAGVLTAVAIPALAGTDGDPAGPSPSDLPQVDVELAPALLAALQRDLGLDEEQARDRLNREAWASQTAAALREELGADRYAGAWLSDDAEALTVAVTDEAAAAQVRAAGADAAVVRYGERDLDQVRGALDEHATAADAVTGWYVDVSDNRVVVLAPDWAQAQAQSFATAAGVPGEAVRVVSSDEQPRLLQEPGVQDLRGGDAYLIANAARCSIGFSVAGVADQGGAGFVTAGHCALAGVTTTGIDGTPQGEFVAASFPGVGLGGPDDWGVVAVNAQWLAQPLVNDFAGGTLPVAGSLEAPVGAAVCKYGSTTGVSCGVIQAKNATVNYPEGTVTGLTRTDVCAEPGDSGGSWLSGDQAQGITSGGSGDCTVGGTTFFQPLAEVLELNDLALVTTAEDPPGQEAAGQEPPGQGGDAPPPAAAACESHEFRFWGRIAESGGFQVQPDGRFYRALSAGTHTVCLAGPRSSNFDLALQQWDGHAWQTVAQAASVTSNELVTFSGEAGFYRIVVGSADGTGRYRVGLSFASQ